MAEDGGAEAAGEAAPRRAGGHRQQEGRARSPPRQPGESVRYPQSLVNNQRRVRVCPELTTIRAFFKFLLFY